MPATTTLISVHEFSQLMASNPGITLLDVRTPDEFEEVHVAGSRNVPLGSLDAQKLLDEKTVGLNQSVYLICRTDNRSRIAAEMFRAAGHPRVYVVFGGTFRWIAESLPVISGP